MTVKERFAKIAEKTFCPFARGAHIAYGPEWEVRRSFGVNMDSNAAALTQFRQLAEQEAFHGFVSEVYLPVALRSFEGIRCLFAVFLQELSSRDPSGGSCMQEEIGRRGWQFEYCNLRLFGNVFAPCYEEWHPKYSYNQDYAFFFFQPEGAFDLCGISRDQKAEKDAIRERFRRGGRPYNSDLIDQRIEALLYMSPLQIADPPVRWWEDLRLGVAAFFD